MKMPEFMHKEIRAREVRAAILWRPSISGVHKRVAFCLQTDPVPDWRNPEVLVDQSLGVRVGPVSGHVHERGRATAEVNPLIRTHVSDR